MSHSPHHKSKSQKRSGKMHAREQVERKQGGVRKLGVLRRETGWVDCMEEVRLGRCGEALSSRGGRGVTREAER